MRSVLPFLAALSVTLSSATADDATLTLARDSKPMATIVIAKDATRAAQFAAFELQWHLNRIVGGEFSIAREDDSVAGLRILVGDSRPVREIGIDPSTLAKQEHVIRFTPTAIALVGRDKEDRGAVEYSQTPSAQALDTWPSYWDEQGTMLATYCFLERFCGVRWFTPTEFGTDLPRKPTLTVRGKDLRREPFMKYRFASYISSEGYDRYTGLWPDGSEGQKRLEAAAYPTLKQRFKDQEYLFAKRGWNTLFRLRRREGGELCPGNHSLYGYYRRFWEVESGYEDKFVGKKEAWFAKGYPGKPPQMCYANRELVQQVAQDACEYFETGKIHLGAQAHGDFFCVEPMDNIDFCKCDECKKRLTGRDANSPFFTNGRNSDYFFTFVNEVAELVHQKHPNKKIVTLAYASHGAPPTSLKLAPNVLVQYCFSCNRLPYDRASYDREVAYLKQWRELYPNETMYLWLYDTFPVEMASNGGFHCFPGFFAKTVGAQFELFRQQNYRGIFHCGLGQEVEAYLTYQLMDDPTLNVEKLLKEYFERMYGPAGEPLRKFYDLVEAAYADPANYAEAIALAKEEGHHHQTAEMAWGYLGNTQRMKELSQYITQAQSAPATDQQKERVKLFQLAYWDYMVEGRAKYVERLKTVVASERYLRTVPFASTTTGGSLDKVDWSEALALTNWRSAGAEPTRRKIVGRTICDDKHWYVQLEEADGLAFSTEEKAGPEERWQLLFALGAGPVRTLEIPVSGKPTLDRKPCAFRVSQKREGGKWTTSIAIPFAAVGNAGGPIRFNAIRRSGASTAQPTWSPGFGELTDPAALRDLAFDPATSVPKSLPTADELNQLEKKDLVVSWKATSETSDGKRVNNPVLRQADGRSWLELQDDEQQCLDFGAGTELDLNGPLTLQSWVRYSPREESWFPALLGKGYDATGGYGLHLRPGGSLWFEIDATDGTRHFYNPTDRSVTFGQWTHVVATYDGQTMRAFINGREAGQGKPVVSDIRKTKEPFRFGWLGAYGYFNGDVREVSVHRRAMTPGEVFGRYKSGR